MSDYTRRQFLKTAVAGAVATVAVPGCATLDGGSSQGVAQRKLTATDWVPLGKTGLKIPRLGMGTGSNGGSVQKKLGQEGFDRLVRYAFDNGVRYIDTAESYATHGMLAAPLKDLPREKLYIQSKIRPKDHPDALAEVDRQRKVLGTDYIDSVLVHCVKTTTWADEFKAMCDGLSEAKQRKWIRGHGASCHGLPGLEGVAGCQWCEVNLCRVNPQGKHTDGTTGEWDEPGNVPAAVTNIRKIHEAGRGVIGMKIIGNGDFTDAADRERSIQYAMHQDWIDAVVIGFQSPAEIDEALERINRALADRVRA